MRAVLFGDSLLRKIWFPNPNPYWKYFFVIFGIVLFSKKKNCLMVMVHVPHVSYYKVWAMWFCCCQKKIVATTAHKHQEGFMHIYASTLESCKKNRIATNSQHDFAILCVCWQLFKRSPSIFLLFWKQIPKSCHSNPITESNFPYPIILKAVFFVRIGWGWMPTVEGISQCGLWARESDSNTYLCFWFVFFQWTYPLVFVE